MILDFEHEEGEELDNDDIQVRLSDSNFNRNIVENITSVRRFFIYCNDYTMHTINEQKSGEGNGGGWSGMGGGRH